VSKVNNRGVNHLLSLLSEAERERILARCEKLPLNIEAVLYEAGSVMGHVYFPLSGMVSLVIGTEDGGTIEVGVVGNEGMVGTPTALDADRSHVKALIQVQGEFLRMGVRDFRLELQRNSVLNHMVHRFAHALTIQISQSVMCNRMHPMEERICRWLLMAHDRAGTDEIMLTQSFIAQMLGIRRPSVTVAAGLLQKAGFIAYSRGHVTILDRVGLENAACECYAIANRELEGLVGADGMTFGTVGTIGTRADRQRA
jgi:CRP-like cAMP-binding protein